MNSLGPAIGRWPLGGNWPNCPCEHEWAQGRNLEETRELLLGLSLLGAGSRHCYAIIWVPIPKFPVCPGLEKMFGESSSETNAIH